MGLQYEYNSCLNRRADYACQIDKEDPEKTNDVSLDHSISEDDDSSWIG